MERTVTLLTICISSEDVLCAADAAVFAVAVLADAATSLDDLFGLLVVVVFTVVSTVVVTVFTLEFFLVADTTVVRTVVSVATFFLEFSFFTVLDFLLRFVLLAVFFAFFFCGRYYCSPKINLAKITQHI